MPVSITLETLPKGKSYRWQISQSTQSPSEVN